MKTQITTLLLAALFASSAFGADHKGHDHSKDKHEKHKDHDDHKGHDHEKEGHSEVGKNGGQMFEVGEGIADLEFVQNKKTGMVKIFLFKEGTDKALKVAKAPRINLTLKGMRKQIKTKMINADTSGKSSTFVAKNNLLKSEIEGVISIKIDGKSYKVKLADDHEGHDHEGHDHEGHDH